MSKMTAQWSAFLTRFRNRRRAAEGARVALLTPPMRVGDPRGVHVRMLLCHRDAPMAVAALKSFFRFVPGNVGLIIHDDGSLLTQDRSTLSHHFPGMAYVNAADADQRVDAELARLGLDRCRELRRTFVLAKKLFDMELYGAGTTFLQLDPDVIFLERPMELLESMRDPHAPIRYNVDVRYPYCWNEDDIIRVTGVTPAPGLNSGLVTIRCDAATLPEVWAMYERCLALPVAENGAWLREQTLTGVYAGWRGARPLAPEYDVCARLLRTGQEHLITHHCLSHQRPYFFDAFLTWVAPELMASYRAPHYRTLAPGVRRASGS